MTTPAGASPGAGPSPSPTSLVAGAGADGDPPDTALVVALLAAGVLLCAALLGGAYGVHAAKERGRRRAALYAAAVQLARWGAAESERAVAEARAAEVLASRKAAVRVSKVTLSAGAMDELNIGRGGGEEARVTAQASYGGTADTAAAAAAASGPWLQGGWPDVTGLWRARASSGDAEDGEEYIYLESDSKGSVPPTPTATATTTPPCALPPRVTGRQGSSSDEPFTVQRSAWDRTDDGRPRLRFVQEYADGAATHWSAVLAWGGERVAGDDDEEGGGGGGAGVDATTSAGGWRMLGGRWVGECDGTFSACMIDCTGNAAAAAAAARMRRQRGRGAGARSEAPSALARFQRGVRGVVAARAMMTKGMGAAAAAAAAQGQGQGSRGAPFSRADRRRGAVSMDDYMHPVPGGGGGGGGGGPGPSQQPRQRRRGAVVSTQYLHPVRSAAAKDQHDPTAFGVEKRAALDDAAALLDVVETKGRLRSRTRRTDQAAAKAAKAVVAAACELGTVEKRAGGGDGGGTAGGGRGGRATAVMPGVEGRRPRMAAAAAAAAAAEAAPGLIAAGGDPEEAAAAAVAAAAATRQKFRRGVRVQASDQPSCRTPEAY
jgi:hypothetical protein